MEDQEKYWIGIKMIDELSNRLNRLLDFYTSPEDIWRASQRELAGLPGMDSDIARSIVQKRNRLDLERAYQKLKKMRVKILTIQEPDYPTLLKEIHRPPPVLFVQGDLLFNHRVALAIVGSRRCSAQGKILAEEFAETLSRLGITIVSGLARGIDSAAHWGALKSKGKTMAVIGCGLDIVYPPENKRLFDQIAEEGSLISEYPPGTPPLPSHFPVRNRIISGLSRGTIVVEARKRSGALITASLSLEQNREVMAIPGNIRSCHHQGTNRLLKSGACLVEKVEDVLDCLNIPHSLTNAADFQTGPPLTESERNMLDLIDFEPKHLDRLALESNLSIGETSSLLTFLELKGLIKKEAGDQYLRLK